MQLFRNYLLKKTATQFRDARRDYCHLAISNEKN